MRKFEKTTWVNLDLMLTEIDEKNFPYDIAENIFYQCKKR